MKITFKLSDRVCLGTFGWGTVVELNVKDEYGNPATKVNFDSGDALVENPFNVGNVYLAHYTLREKIQNGPY